MIGWAITFLLCTLGAAVLGFGGVASAAAGVAQGLFFLFVALFVAALLAEALRDGEPPERRRARR